MAIQKRIAVAGAGIAGLCTAYWLEKKGHTVEIFEKSGQTGGVIRTERENGYLIDLGPNSTLETSDTLRELVDELGLHDQKIYANEASNKRYILRDGKLQAVPTSAGAFLKTDLFSWKAKLRLLKEPFIAPTQGEDVSLADFVRHRLGQEFLDYAINPFVAGVYAGDPGHLSTAAGFPKLYALEKDYGSLILGAIKGARKRKKQKEVAKNRAKMFSFQNGMQTMTDALTGRIQGKVHLHTTVKSIHKLDQGFRLNFEKQGIEDSGIFDAVILCMPAHVAAPMVRPLAAGLSDALSNVKYPPVSVVFTGFRRTDVTHPLDGFGFLIPEAEKRDILGSIWSSSLFPGRAPEGTVAFTSFVGGTRQPANAQLPENELTRLVVKELQSLVGIKSEPVFVRVKKWDKAIPQYNLGYKSIQADMESLENQFPGLYFAGNFKRGISVGDSVLSAFEVAQKFNQ